MPRCSPLLLLLLPAVVHAQTREEKVREDRRKVEAPSKKAAPRIEKPDDDGGFGAGI